MNETKPATQEERPIEPHVIAMCEDMVKVTKVIGGMLFILGKADNDPRLRYNQRLFEVKQDIDKCFPIIHDDGTSISDLCPICIHDQAESCPHERHVRAALLLSAMLRFHALVDLDVTEEEHPDNNEGMVEVEKEKEKADGS